MNKRLRSKDTAFKPEYRKKWKHIEDYANCPKCSKSLTKDNSLDIRTYGQLNVNDGSVIMAYSTTIRCVNCQEIILPAAYRPDWSLVDTSLSSRGVSHFPALMEYCPSCQNDFHEDGEIKYQGYGQLMRDSDLLQINKVSVLCEACSTVVLPAYSPSVMIESY